jgi:hypothetical protein
MLARPTDNRPPPEISHRQRDIPTERIVEDSDCVERGRFAVPDHARELSWSVLRSIESAVEPAFVERWMEER